MYSSNDKKIISRQTFNRRVTLPLTATLKAGAMNTLTNEVKAEAWMITHWP